MVVACHTCYCSIMTMSHLSLFHHDHVTLVTVPSWVCHTCHCFIIIMSHLSLFNETPLPLMGKPFWKTRLIACFGCRRRYKCMPKVCAKTFEDFRKETAALPLVPFCKNCDVSTGYRISPYYEPSSYGVNYRLTMDDCRQACESMPDMCDGFAYEPGLLKCSWMSYSGQDSYTLASSLPPPFTGEMEVSARRFVLHKQIPDTTEREDACCMWEYACICICASKMCILHFSLKLSTCFLSCLSVHLFLSLVHPVWQQNMKCNHACRFGSEVMSQRSSR